MSQAQTTDFTIDSMATNGDQLAVILNRMFGALVSTHSGASRPAYLTAGGLWAKPGAGNDFTVYLYTGSADIQILAVTSGTVHIAGVDLSSVYSKAEVDALLSKKYDKTGGKIYGSVKVSGAIDASGDVTAFASIPADPLSITKLSDGVGKDGVPTVFDLQGTATISQTLHLIVQGQGDAAPNDYHIVIQVNQAVSDIIDAIIGEITSPNITATRVGTQLKVSSATGALIRADLMFA
jgi:hypothetical protein